MVESNNSALSIIAWYTSSDNRDFGYDYFGFKTLERSYLLKLNGKIVERPQHMLMRVSVGIHLTDMASAIETYELMSKKYFTHATPTLFNSGTPKPQMSSSFPWFFLRSKNSKMSACHGSTYMAKLPFLFPPP